MYTEIIFLLYIIIAPNNYADLSPHNSIKPSNFQVSKPSNLNNLQDLPSNNPTSYPTLDYYDYLNKLLYQDFLKLYTSYISLPNTRTFFNFASFNYKGKNIYGDCNDWSNFSSYALSPPVDEITYVSMTAIFDYQDLQFSFSNNKQSFTCKDSSIVNKFIENFILNKPISLVCDFTYWKIVSCEFGLVFCINCTDVCNLCPGNIDPDIKSLPGYSGSSEGMYFISSCKPNCYHYSISYGILKFDFDRDLNFPKITLPLEVSSHDSYTIISTKLSLPGRILCAGIPSGNVLTSTSLLLANAPFNRYLLTSSNVSQVYLLNLYKDTAYDIYCYTEDFR